ncbi:MAG: cysteine--tRNA ligase [Candidatus Paceibacterota bacterium]
MKIYDTLSGRKKRITKKGEKKFFVCGPTVYDYAHIGHARTYVAFDFIVKYLRSKGWDIFYLQNITNIDDKIIDKSNEEGKSAFAVASFFENTYYEDMRILGVDSVNEYAKASDHIEEIKKQIKTLIKKDYAYQTKQGVYFEIKKFKRYGKLSRQKIDKQRSGSRIDPDPDKKDSSDFALWKFSKTKGEPAWEAPWGRGRPGWHIEDTAITEKFFGPQYHIHGGAEDLKFPHHEAEIAQQESASSKKPFVKFWLHTGVLTTKKGEKMSKSLKNFVSIRKFLNKHSPELLRWLIISHHYRSKLPYSNKTLKQAEKSLANIKNFLGKVSMIINSKKSIDEDKRIKVKSKIKRMEKGFNESMKDDFNTPKAIGEIFNLIKNVQPNIWSIKKEKLEMVSKSIKELLLSLGLEIQEETTPTKVKSLVRKREKLRSNEQFIKADDLRKKILGLGYEVEDTPIGPFVTRKIDDEIL